MPLLVNQAEKQVMPGLPKELGLAMNQEQLRIEREQNPLAAVETKQGSSRWLCQTIHIGEDQGEVV